MRKFLRICFGIIIFTAILTCCERPERIPKITTINVRSSDISYRTVTLRGLITDMGTYPVDDYGLMVSRNSSFLNPTVIQKEASASTDTFNVGFADLLKNTPYYFRAYLTSNSKTIYGETRQFTTLDTGIPQLATTEASDVTLSTAKSGGTIISDGGETITRKGLCISKSAGSDITNALDTTVNLTQGNSWTDEISGLEQGTKYYVKSYAVNLLGTAYGNELEFTTRFPLNAVSGDATSVDTVSAVLNGTVTPDNTACTVTFEWGPTNSYGHTVNATVSPVNGKTPVSVNATLAALDKGSVYHYRVKIENANNSFTGDDISFSTKLPDADKNIYSVIEIGTQVWMKENLRTSKFNDKTAIPEVNSGTDWSTMTSPGFCYYNNDATTYKNTYGALYNWYAVNTGKLCPVGWHVSGENDFSVLFSTVGGYSAGGNLKTTGTLEESTGLWKSPNSGATNSSGFSVLPAGIRMYSGDFTYLSEIAWFWLTNDSNLAAAFSRNLVFDNTACTLGTTDKHFGFSIRCVKDQ
ncbi:MAG: fibrobacter succinogenes major paralogous domain-containing protein [Bacteroidales bacterium]